MTLFVIYANETLMDILLATSFPTPIATRPKMEMWKSLLSTTFKISTH